MSPNTVFPLYERPHNDITERILAHPRVTYEVQDGVLVLAMRDELLAHASIGSTAPRVQSELSRIATRRGSLATREGGPHPDVADDVELWTLNDEHDNSIDQARRLRQLTVDRDISARRGAEAPMAVVTPNHVCTVTPFDSCPATPPHAVPPLSAAERRRFVEPIGQGRSARVVVIDTGYIRTDPPYDRLDARVTSIAGQWLDSLANPPAWVDCEPDVLDADGDQKLDGIAGHGTFIAGLVAHECRKSGITVVGQRHECMSLADDPVDRARLFSSEFEIAQSLLVHSDAEVVSCGFAFPTLDGYPSIAFSSVMAAIRAQAPPRSEVAVVAPAGNESSARPYWPAAHPEVIGVAASNRRGTGRAWFSNWGSWLDCCTRGQDVFSAFIDWEGPIDGAPATDIERFGGWATWNGTSFAAPKVSAAIAKVWVENHGAVSPVAAFQMLVAGTGGVLVSSLTDATLTGSAGVALPYLYLG